MYLVWLYMPYRATPLGILNGGVPEWLKGTDCKSVALCYVGSNPTPSTIYRSRSQRAGIAQW